jgi:hypothetical protein
MVTGYTRNSLQQYAGISDRGETLMKSDYSASSITIADWFRPRPYFDRHLREN